MWRVGCVTMMKRSGRYFCGKDARGLILTVLEELLSSCRSKMVGYATKAFSWRSWLHVSENVVADCCVRGGEWLLGSPLSFLNWVRLLLKVLLVVPLGAGRCPY